MDQVEEELLVFASIYVVVSHFECNDSVVVADAMDEVWQPSIQGVQ